MTLTQNGAQQAMLAHHQALQDGVRERAAKVRDAATGDGAEQAGTEFVEYLVREVLSHALAEELTIYRAASERAGLGAEIDEMVGEHQMLTAAVERLASAPGSPDAAGIAEEIASSFVTHVGKENDVVLPALVADEHIDLVRLLAAMHELTEAAKRPKEETASAPDPQKEVLSLLLESATALAQSGHADQACRLAASAWSALRGPRPDLAVRVTAALHRLTRQVDGISSAPPPSVNGARAGTDPPLDVRSLAPAQRHQSIFATYGELAPGTGFVLVNDHDPKPLRYQFEAEHTGEFTWDALESGPTVWRVRIGRSTPAGKATTGADAHDAHEEPELDVRSLPHGQRHESIFAAYAELGAGVGFVLVNDHDPKPLRYQFEAQYPDEFTWDYHEAGPEVWRVRIGKPQGR